MWWLCIKILAAVFRSDLYYLRFPDREQYDFLISLTGLWGSQGNGTQLMKDLLGPIMQGDSAVFPGTIGSTVFTLDERTAFPGILLALLLWLCHGNRSRRRLRMLMTW